MARGGLRGDFAKLDRLIRSTRAIALGTFGARAVSRMGDEGHRLAVTGASAGKNPQGRRWAPLKAQQEAALGALALALGFAKVGSFGLAGAMTKSASDIGSVKPLAWMAGTLVLGKMRGGFVIRSTSPHGIYHQTGAKRRNTQWRLPVRRVVPIMRRKLPKQWRKAFDIAVGKVWVDLFRGRGR